MRYNKQVKLFVIFIMIVLSVFVNANISYAGTLSEDINGINEEKYPGVKSMIQSLQKKHSNYSFKVYYTGIDWTEAITMEYQGHGSSPKNLFSASSKYQGKWYCPICGSKTYDTGWYCASIDAIKYMMDPRNSLDETSVYQFKNLESADVTADNIRTVINSKYSSFSYINNETAINSIVKASNNYNLNGYSILAKIINEQGKGTSALATGKGYNGQYVGYYNFFNVGAYGNGTDNVMLNGLKYAKNKNWNSVEASILGGSEYYKSQYIGKGQNTLHYQRFNVVYNPSLFSHQYQQDIMGAQTSATLLKGYYSASGTIGSVKHEFIIPLYENMPKSVCSRPSTSENSKLEYENAKVLTDRIEVKASPNSSRVISYLNKNESIKVLERSAIVAKDGTCWDIIVSNTDGTYGYVNTNGITQPIRISNYLFDTKYYADNNPDLKAVFGYNEQNLMNHFMTFGIKEGRVASKAFDVKYYLNNNLDLKSAFGNNYQAAYNHFVNSGCNEYRKSSPTYDGTFYRYYYSDLTRLSSVDLLNHYVNNGISEGRIGGLDSDVEKILFDAEFYSTFNPDLKAAFGNNSTLLKIHWLQNGISEGRKSSLNFDPVAYKELNSDLSQYSYKKLVEHFITFGIKEGRASSYIFDAKKYIEYNSDLRAAFGTNYKLAYIHFMNFGIKEKRKTSDKFDVNVYMSSYEDLRNAYGSDIKSYYIHYLIFGRNEGRKGI